MDSIISYFLDKFPGVLGMLLVGIIVWRFSVFYFTRFKKTEDIVGAHGEQIVETKNALLGIQQTNKEHRESLKEIQQTSKVHQEALSGIKQSIKEIRKSFKEMRKEMRKNIESLPCDSHRKAILNVESSFFSKNEFMPILYASLSPKRLTEYGVELYQKSGVQSALENNLQRFIEQIEALAPKTAYDAEKFALHVIFNSTDEDCFIPVKNWIFNNPVFHERDLRLTDICYVASLQLRDAYLEKHPELMPVVETA